MAAIPIPQGASIGEPQAAPPSTAPTSLSAPASTQRVQADVQPGAVAIPQGAVIGEPATAGGGENQDKGFWHGTWQQFKPIWDEASQQNARIHDAPDLMTKTAAILQPAFEDASGISGAKMVWGLVQGAYEEGKKSVQHAGAAAGRYVEAGRELTRGNFRAAEAHGEAAAGEMSEAGGHGMAAMLPGVGPAAAQAGEDIGGGKPRQGAGEAVTAVGSVLLSELLGKLKGARAKSAPAAFSETEAATKLTDAVNPEPGQIPKYSANVGKHVHGIMDYAERNGIKLDSRAGLRDAARGLEKERATAYYEKVLNPVKEEIVSISNVRDYQGALTGEGRNSANLGQLDSRLSQINDTPLDQQTPQMKTEAAGIRKALYEGIGKKLGVEPQQIAELRASMGELKHVADTTEFTLNQERNAANKAARKPYKGSVSPVSQNFIPDQAIRKVINASTGKDKLFGKQVRNAPPDRAVAEVFQHMNPKAAAEIITGATQPAPAQRTPLWKKEPGNSATIGEQMRAKDAERGQQAAAQQQRQAQVNQQREQMRAEAEARKAKNAAQHGAVQKKAAEQGLGASAE